MENPVAGSVDLHEGKWRARMRIPGHGQKSFGHYDTRAEAEGVLEAARLQLEGTAFEPGLRKFTLAAFAVHWFEKREETHSNSEGERNLWDTHIKGTDVAALVLDDAALERNRKIIKRRIASIAEARSKRTGKTRSKHTIRNVLTMLRAVLRGAVDADLIAVSPADGIRLPRLAAERDGDTEEAIRFLTEEELNKVHALPASAFQDAKQEWAFRSAFAVGIYAGLRTGELHGLRWSDLQLDPGRAEVVVRRSRRKSTKTGKVARVPLLAPAVEALKQWHELSKPKHDDDLVWPAEHGGCHSKGFDWGWRDHTEKRRIGAKRVREGIRTRAGIARNVTWYEATRHTCATHLLLGTWVPEVVPRALELGVVSRWLRHSSTQVTERYAHVTANALHTAVRPNPGPDLVASTGDENVAFVRSVRSDDSEKLSHLRDLNPGPTVYETVALPLS